MEAGRSFDKDSTTDDVLDGIDLTGRVALVTGASGGLGAETARALASRGAAVTLTARNLVKAEQVAASIRDSVSGARVEVMELELDRPDSVRAFAKRFLRTHPALHMLVNNAGIMACPLERTPEGWEMQFATNHLGHFLLAGLVTPALLAAAPSRVVSVSSAGHRFSPLAFDDIHFERRPYDKWKAYGQSKTANVLLAVELDRRLRDRGVRAYGLHPGGIMTELGRHLSADDIEELQSRAPSGRIEWKTVPAGAATSVWAATAPELDGLGGIYLEDCQLARPRASEEQMGGVADYALDTEAASRLWSVSEQTVGQVFGL